MKSPLPNFFTVLLLIVRFTGVIILYWVLPFIIAVGVLFFVFIVCAKILNYVS